MQIEFQNVSFSYANATKPALSNISFTVEKGEFVAIIGVSGSGKSTLCRLMLGLCDCQSGTIRINGKEKEDKELFPSVGMVFQYPEQQLFAETVFEEVAFALKCHGIAENQHKEMVDKALKEVGLDPATFCERNPFMLSGGEKRRVAIASVLVMNPQILIFDEPSAGLDLRGKEFIANLARAKHAQGVTVIWITHHMEEAAELAQKILVFNEGSLLTWGTAEEVFNDKNILSAGLDLPDAAKLMKYLKEYNAPVNGHAVKTEQVIQEIIDWKTGASERT